MIERKSNSILRGARDVYDYVIEDLNKELRANGYRKISYARFKNYIYHYWREVFTRVVFNYESVELGGYFGSLHGHKILCTRFNPFALDINKTDGYYYFIFWHRPKTLARYGVRIPKPWKRKMYRNVIDNGADYPEILENQYGKINGNETFK
jgi:hypothetical protein